MSEPMGFTVYLSGEIHTDWRQRIMEACNSGGLNIEFFEPVIDHQSSDDCGVVILGEENSSFWKDHKGAKLNAIRTRTMIERADLVVVRFGEKYRQWNAAFDAGMATALGKSLITVHEPNLNHALKEVDAAALAVCRTTEQVVQTLKYVVCGELHSSKGRMAAE